MLRLLAVLSLWVISVPAFANKQCRAEALRDYQLALDACDAGAGGDENPGNPEPVNAGGCKYFAEVKQTHCARPGEKCDYFAQVQKVVCGVRCSYYADTNQVECSIFP